MKGEPGTLEYFDSTGMELSALCSDGHPVRRVIVDNAALIARYGATALVSDVIRRITCRECGKKVRCTVSAKNAPGPPPSFGYAPPKRD